MAINVLPTKVLSSLKFSVIRFFFSLTEKLRGKIDHNKIYQLKFSKLNISIWSQLFVKVNFRESMKFEKPNIIYKT